MAYYSVTGNPVTNTRGNPADSRRVRVDPDGLCHGRNGDRPAWRDDRQTWTGAHDFSSCTSVLVPTISGSSENSTKAASTAFVQQGIGRRCRRNVFQCHPLANGVATSGVGAGAARYDHVHPLSNTTLNSVMAATGSATIANGDNPIAWNWAQTTAAQVAFKFGETTAATGGSGSQYLVSMATAAVRRPIRSAQTRAVDTINISRTGTVTVTD